MDKYVAEYIELLKLEISNLKKILASYEASLIQVPGIVLDLHSKIPPPPKDSDNG